MSDQEIFARWQCHKQVSAAKIAKIYTDDEGEVIWLLEIVPGARSAVMKVKNELIARGAPEVGDYYVRYDDGYESWSPKKAFEDGYTRIV